MGRTLVSGGAKDWGIGLDATVTVDDHRRGPLSLVSKVA
jgi:hypothetical protein